MEDSLQREMNDAMTILCVEKLPQNVTKTEIYKLFEEFGRVLDVSLTSVVVDSSTILPSSNATLYFETVEIINNIMAHRPFYMYDNEIFLRRFIPQSLDRGNQSQHMTNRIMVTTSSDNPVEILPGNSFIKNYLSQFGGSIENYERLSDKIAYVQFLDYDTVDLITLSQSQHFIDSQRIFLDRYFDDSEIRSSIEHQREFCSSIYKKQHIIVDFLSD